MTNVEIAKKQVEFVKSKLSELDAQTGGECKGMIIADYSKEEYEKFLPEENWGAYVETQFLFIHFLKVENLNNNVIFQHIDWEGFQKFAAEKGLKNDAAARSYYAIVKYGRESLKK